MPNTRNANASDSKDIFNWRNDELTRQMSKTTNLVEWDEHNSWFTASLSNPYRLLVICENEVTKEKIAIVRFDIEDERALISINISPKMRGKRMAYGCLKDAIFFFKKHFPNVRFIDAEIKNINIPSQRSFMSAGFLLVKKDTNIFYYEYVL